MMKFHADEVPTPVIILVEQCVAGVQFNQAQFLCDEFLTNCQEAKDRGKTFYYPWLLLSILLVAGELPQGSHFPSIEDSLSEAVQYTFPWATKDAVRVSDIKIFLGLHGGDYPDTDLSQPQMSPTIYNNLQGMAEFKADMHNLYIQARKDPK